MVYFINGIRRFIITAIDIKSGFAFSYAYKSLSSQSAKDFMQKMDKVSPFDIKRVQTDNGYEFAKHFREYLKKQNITHFHTYPRQLKVNTHIDRFNRIMMDWLLWYNTKRRHHFLNLVSPLRYMLDNLLIQNSHLGWAYTNY